MRLYDSVGVHVPDILLPKAGLDDPLSDLFKTVILDGALPRKTFSMGEAHEKRFYLECRQIV